MLPTPTLNVPTPAAETPATTAGESGMIAYIHGGDLWLLDLATGQMRQLTTDGQSRDPAWSADGLRLALTTTRDGLPQIDLLRADGSERTPLTEGPSQASFPAFGRDGALYFVRRQPGDTPPIEVLRRDASGAETVVHSELGGLCGPIGLSVAADQRIALALNCGRGSYTLIATPGVSETLDLGRAINESVCAAPGVWSPRDTRIAAITAPECAFQDETDIVVIDLAGGQPQARQILRSQRISGLTWSPDGRLLVYARPDGLWLLRSDEQDEPRRIATTGEQPAWRPGATVP